MEKLELVVQALQQRIGEIVSQYETHIAILRAEITTLTDTKNDINPSPEDCKTQLQIMKVRLNTLKNK
jgi:hypothetical protein